MLCPLIRSYRRYVHRRLPSTQRRLDLTVEMSPRNCPKWWTFKWWTGAMGTESERGIRHPVFAGMARRGHVGKV